MDEVDVLEYTDTVDCQLKYATVADVLQFAEATRTNKRSSIVTDALAFSDRLSTAKISNVLAVDYLGFTDRSVPRVAFAQVTDYVLFLDSVKRPPGANDRFAFTDYCSAYVSQLPTERLSYRDSLTSKINRSPAASDSLGLSDFASVYNTKPWFPIIEPYGLAEITGIRFTRQGRTLDLPKPKFGDVDTLTLKRINRTTRGNSLIVAKIPTWWNKTLKRFEWDYLTKKQFYDLENYLDTVIGVPVQINGIYTSDKTFFVIFLKPEAEFSQIGFDNRTVILDMQVVNLSPIPNINSR